MEAKETSTTVSGPASGMAIPRRALQDSTVCRVETADQFRAIASPIRSQILSIITNLTVWNDQGEVEQGVSIGEIAEQLRRNPTSIYRHIDTLIQVGLVVEVGSRPSGGRDASIFASAGEHIVLVGPKEEGETLEAMGKYIKNVASVAGSESALAAIDRELHPETIGPHDVGGANARGWLDETQRKELNGLLLRMMELFTDSRRRPGTRFMAATMLVRPSRLVDQSIADEPLGQH